MKKAKKVISKESSSEAHEHNRGHKHVHKGACCSSSTWITISVILAILFVASLILGLTGVLSSGASDSMSQSRAEAKANEYVSLLSNAETPLTVASVNKENGMYRIEISVLGQTESWYMSPNGDFFFPSAFSLEDIKMIVSQQPPVQQPPAAQGQVNVNLEDANILGEQGTGVLMVEYSSATCPFCARYNAETYPSMKSEYVDSGKITYVYKHFIRNDVDILAANAMECAGEQGKFFEYKDNVYANQNLLSQQTIYSTWAEELDLNIADFDSCFSERRYTAKANAETQEGQLNGVTGTPGFLVNSRLIAGAQPFANFEAAIEAELAN